MAKSNQDLVIGAHPRVSVSPIELGSELASDGVRVRVSDDGRMAWLSRRQALPTVEE
jgi:hypothetical protein